MSTKTKKILLVIISVLIVGQIVIFFIISSDSRPASSGRTRQPGEVIALTSDATAGADATSPEANRAPHAAAESALTAEQRRLIIAELVKINTALAGFNTIPEDLQKVETQLDQLAPPSASSAAPASADATRELTRQLSELQEQLSSIKAGIDELQHATATASSAPPDNSRAVELENRLSTLAAQLTTLAARTDELRQRNINPNSNWRDQ